MKSYRLLQIAVTSSLVAVSTSFAADQTSGTSGVNGSRDSAVVAPFSAASSSAPSSSADTSSEDARAQRRASAASRAARNSSTDTSISEQQVVVPLRKEEINVDKQAVSDGDVRIRKTVKTESVNKPVELRKETVTVERVPAGTVSTDKNARSTEAFKEGEIVVPVSHEEAVVSKRVVEGDAVVAKTHVQTEKQNVKDSVRSEGAEVIDNGKNKNVQVKGDIKEGQSSRR